MSEKVVLRHVKIYADGADLESMVALAEKPHIAGFTTNPTLMRKSGVSDYEGFARKVLETITDQPISFEVFADDARDAAPSPAHLVLGPKCVRQGSGDGHQTQLDGRRGRRADRGRRAAQCDRVDDGGPGRDCDGQARRHPGGDRIGLRRPIADTGQDPIPIMTSALAITSAQPGVSLLWASPREILNVRQADDIGVDIITVTHDILAKLSLFGKDLDDYSLETVKMFDNDARAAGYKL